MTRLLTVEEAAEPFGAVLSLCDLTGNMCRPWAEAGYECWCVDVRHSIRGGHRDGNIRFEWGDVRSWCPPPGIRFDFVAAFPPCTHLSGSGARDWIAKGHFLLTDALQLWTACLVAACYSAAPYMIENPVGALSRHMREPDHTFHPCDFAGWLQAEERQAEAYTKKTHLWTGGGFAMPDRKPTPPDLGSMMHRLPPDDDRADARSATPRGFALAVFAANAPHLKAARSAVA